MPDHDILKETYKKILEDCLESFGIGQSSVDLVFSRDFRGGQVKHIDKFGFKGDAYIKVKGSILVGLPSRPYDEEERALIFHEVSHLLFFSYMGFRNGQESHQEIIGILGENPSLVPWSEVVSEFLTAKYGNLREYILSRKFEEWKWWKRMEAFGCAKESVDKLLKKLEKADVLSDLEFCLDSEWSVQKRKEIYSLMQEDE